MAMRAGPDNGQTRQYGSTRVGVRWGLLGLALAAAPALAQPPVEPAKKGPVAKATCPAAAFSARLLGSREFRSLPDKADLYPGDLLVGLPGAGLETPTGVTLKALADYDGRSPLPILEAAFTLHANPEVDLDFTLDRGRVDVTNTKASGPATVLVRFWNQQWRVTLDSPGTRVGLELCGRWPAGVRFRPAEGKEVSPPSPNASLVLLVLKGSALVKVGGVSVGMGAPPGPALLEWDSLTGPRPQPQKLDKLPDWAEPEANLSERGQKVAAAVEKFRQARAANADAALDAFLRSADPVEQRVGLVTCGATDDLDRLGKSLAGAKTLEEWDFGITVLRHWLGRGPGQDQKLYEALQAGPRYTPAHARTVLQLLLGFDPEELKQPETFEVLIEYLRHDKPGIRNLAAWHLVRLVPQGKAIGYKPDGSAADHEKTYQEWKKLVPTGKLPPAAPANKE
jgi:hypothetical protein